MKRLIYITVSDFLFNKGKLDTGQHLYFKSSIGHMVILGIHFSEDKKSGRFYMVPIGKKRKKEYDELEVYVSILVHVNVKNIQKTNSRL